MASGKSTIGRLLAESLGYTFYDTDRLISSWKGRSVEQIFNSDGESTYRQFEKEMIRFVSELDKVIIGTGGGLPIYHKNLYLMKTAGSVIYLQADVNTLAERIKNDSAIRPLHPSHQSEAEMKGAIKERLETRQTYYLQAHYVIDTSTDLKTILQKILDCFH